MELGDLEQAWFVSRPNRFAAVVESRGGLELAHVPNSGRMTELLVPGAAVFLAPAPEGRGRKTRCDLALVEYGGALVSVDSRLPPELLAESIGRGGVPELGGYSRVDAEVRIEDSRIDLLLSGRRGRLYVEAKSVNKVEDGTALFPDAATARGTKHVRSLLRAVEQGSRAAVAFVIQRPDAARLVPDEESDPLFCKTLRQAAERGLRVLAYSCAVTPQEVSIRNRTPVVL